MLLLVLLFSLYVLFFCQDSSLCFVFGCQLGLLFEVFFFHGYDCS